MKHITDDELSYLAHLLGTAPIDFDAEATRSMLAQKVENAQRRREGNTPRVSDEQLVQLRHEARGEGNASLVAACDVAAFSRNPSALSRCWDALSIRTLQA